MKWLSFLISFSLKSILSATRTVAPACFLGPFACYNIVHSIALREYLSSVVRHISWRQQIGSSWLLYKLRLSIFRVIIKSFVLTDILLCVGPSPFSLSFWHGLFLSVASWMDLFFSSVYIIPLSSFCRTDLVLINSFSLCLSESYFSFHYDI